MGIEVDFSEEGQQDFKPLEAKATETQQEVKAPIIEDQKPLHEIFKPLEGKDTKSENPVEKTAVDLTEEQVTAYLKSKYQDRQFEKLDDLLKPQETIKEVEKVVDPWEDVIDDEDKAYLNYKRETGRTRKEFEFLSQDIAKMSPLDLAIERVRKDTGLNTLSKEKAVAYLESKLNIDLSTDELDSVGEIELNSYAKPYRESLEAEKEKYRTPLENAIKAKENLPKEEYVELSNGEKMPKTKYDDLLQRRNKYVEDITKAVNSVAASDFKVTIDDNGEKRTLDFKYDYSQDDKQSMLSEAKDIDATIAKRYKANDQFNHQGLAEAMWWGDKANQQKVISAAVNQALATFIEEQAARDNNETFAPRPLQSVKNGKEGYGDLVTGTQTRDGFGVKISV
jgi:hypothetical protein